MRLLAIDTAFEACSVAVAGGGRSPIVASEVIGRGHAERLFGMIAATLNEAGVTFDELDRIAVTVGPGSFTGLRVGIAAARGLALVVGCPVIGVGTLGAHAAKARGLAGAVPVVAVIDARRDEVYGQRFAADGIPIGDPTVGAAHLLPVRSAMAKCWPAAGRTRWCPPCPADRRWTSSIATSPPTFVKLPRLPRRRSRRIMRRGRFI